MKTEWSKWILYGWLAFGVLGAMLEFIGLHNDKDNLPPLTTVIITTIKVHWWVAIPVLALPVWLFVHFGRRIAAAFAASQGMQ